MKDYYEIYSEVDTEDIMEVLSDFDLEYQILMILKYIYGGF